MRPGVRTYVRSSVTLGVASSVANDVIMRTAGSPVASAVDLWRYGDWRHVAPGCNTVVTSMLREILCFQSYAYSLIWT